HGQLSGVVFAYLVSPTIEYAIPNSSPKAGGGMITIFGSFPTDIDEVTLNGAEAIVSQKAADKLIVQAITPTVLQLGTGAIVVKSGCCGTGELLSGFHYYDEPAITS